MTILQYLQHHQSRHTHRITGIGLIATAAADITRHGLGKVLASPLANATCTLATHIPALATLAGFLTSISDFDGTAAYRTLSRTPTLIMCGTMDRVTPPHHSAAIAAALSAAEFVDVPGAGHLLMLDRPDIVNTKLDALLKRVRKQLTPRPRTPTAPALPATTPLLVAA